MSYAFVLLFLVAIPCLVLNTKPVTKPSQRLLQLLGAILIGYLLLNLSLHMHHQQQMDGYESCRHGDGPYALKDAQEFDKHCPPAPVSSGASNLFYLWLGWIPAMAYIGFWELVWRYHHRRTILALAKNFKGRRASNLLIIISIPVWVYMAALLLAAP